MLQLPVVHAQEAEPDPREDEEDSEGAEPDAGLIPVNPFATAKGCWGCNSELPELPIEKAKDFKMYIPVKLTVPQTYYRMWGGIAPLRSTGLGTYYSFFPPAGDVGFMRDQMSLLPEWGNTMTDTNAVEIPAGSIVYIGPAAPVGSYSGGGIQVFVPNP